MDGSVGASGAYRLFTKPVNNDDKNRVRAHLTPKISTGILLLKMVYIDGLTSVY